MATYDEAERLNDKNAKLAKMDGAATMALLEFDGMWAGLDDEERQTMGMLIDWLKKHYRAAGYKRLLHRGLFKKEL